MTTLDPELLEPDFLKWVAYEYATDADRERFTPYLKRLSIEANYERWLQTMFPAYVTAPLAEHQHELWRWVWDIQPDDKPYTQVCIWGRGGAKSTSAEMAAVALGALGKRKYLLYICETQDQADDHVQNIATMLESEEVAKFYPELGEPLIGKHGNSKGWRRNRVRTASGLTIDAMGLDSAARGVKLDEQRPDAMVIDDIDRDTDTPKATAKKIATLTKSLIPAGAKNLVVLAIQNLIHADSVFAKLADRTADFLRRRKISGPIPAIKGFKCKQLVDGTYKILEGVPTWEGFDLDRAEELLNDIGLDAFLAECQHQVDVVKGALWNKEMLEAGRVLEAPRAINNRIIAIDPADGDIGGDGYGVTVACLGEDGHGYIEMSEEWHNSPAEMVSATIQLYHDVGAGEIIIEKNHGGKWIPALFFETDSKVNTDTVWAADGKLTRAKPIAAFFQETDERIATAHMVGVHLELEQQLRRFTGKHGEKSPDRLDSMVWALTHLMLRGKPKSKLKYRG